MLKAINSSCHKAGRTVFAIVYVDGLSICRSDEMLDGLDKFISSSSTLNHLREFNVAVDLYWRAEIAQLKVANRFHGVALSSDESPFRSSKLTPKCF